MKYLSYEDNPRVYHLIDGVNLALAIDSKILVIVDIDHKVYMDKEALTDNKQDNKIIYEFLRCFSSISCIHGYNKKEVMKQVKAGKILLW